MPSVDGLAESLMSVILVLFRLFNFMGVMGTQFCGARGTKWSVRGVSRYPGKMCERKTRDQRERVLTYAGEHAGTMLTKSTCALRSAVTLSLCV